MQKLRTAHLLTFFMHIGIRNINMRACGHELSGRIRTDVYNLIMIIFIIMLPGPGLL